MGLRAADLGKVWRFDQRHHDLAEAEKTGDDPARSTA
jgi:hypothetical protein